MTHLDKGRLLKEFYSIELFAGTGCLTAALRSLELCDSFGVDVKLPTSLNAVTCSLIRWCIRHNTYFAVENPGRSFMWQTASFKELIQESTFLEVSFHHCRYGSARRKLTKFVHNVPSFQQLESYCQNNHLHEPWGQDPNGHWRTSGETAYPWNLCRAMAAKLVTQLKADGVHCNAPVFALQEASLQSMRAATDIQPRRGLPPMVSEFQCITAYMLASSALHTWGETRVQT